MTVEKKKLDFDIDIISLVRLVLKRRLFVIKVTFLCVLLGLIIAFTSKVEFQATCKLLPEQGGAQSKSRFGKLSGLAGLAGINIGLDEGGALIPQLYPEIVKSLPFQLDLINQPVYFEAIDSTVSSYYYFKEVDRLSFGGYLKEYTIGLPFLIKGWIIGDDEEKTPEINNKKDLGILHLSKEEKKILEAYKERVNVSTDIETGIINVSLEMPDPYVAAKLTDILVEKLTDEVTEYKLEKIKLKLDFINKRFLEAEKVYKEKQYKYANFVDKNINLSSSVSKIETERLENEVVVAFDVYKELLVQLEQSKIKVKEETPVFTVLEPVNVPIKKSKPKRLLILVLFFGLGIFSSITYILIKNYFQND